MNLFAKLHDFSQEQDQNALIGDTNEIKNDLTMGLQANDTDPINSGMPQWKKSAK